MNLAKVFNEINKLKKTDKDSYYLISEFFTRFGDGKMVSIQPDRIIDCDNKTFFKNKHDKIKILSRSNYFEKRRKILEEKGQQGVVDFKSHWEEVYDYKLYEKEIEKLEKTCKIFRTYKLKAKVVYDKKYKKATVEDQPSSIWIRVSW